MADKVQWALRSLFPWIRLVALVAAILWLLPGCSQKEKFAPDLEGGLGTDSLFADTTLTSVAEHSASLGQAAGDASASRRLVVANWDGYVSRVFLYFSLSPDTTVKVTSAKLFLYATRIEGAAEPPAFEISTLSDSLIQTGLRWGNMPKSGDPIATFGLRPQREDSVVVDVTGPVSAWAQGTSTNRGFMIKCSDEFSANQAIVEFASSEDPQTRPLAGTDSSTIKVRPVLRVVSQVSADSTELTELLAAEDVFADTLTVARSDTVLTVANGFPARTFLKFDYSGIPREATVTRAVLKLAADMDASSFDSMAVVCHAVLDTVTGFAATYGTLGSATTVLKRDTLATRPAFSIDVTPLVQPQISQLVKVNYGLVIKSPDETFDLDFVTLVSTRSGQSDLAPRLEIHYRMPPLPWYRRD